jgi:hypothetical protein
MSWFKNRYNKKSAKKLGWHPRWFGAEQFDRKLVEAIKEFQREFDLDVDGMCGSMTFRRITAERESQATIMESDLRKKDHKHIVCNGEKIAINWDKVDINFMKEGCFSMQSRERKPSMVVTHWDATLSAKSCKRILEKREISTHFVIDNDGTIVQLVDTNHVAWHAGRRRVNKASVGIDISNAVYTKYQKTYVSRGFGERPVVKGWRVHGRKIKPFLGSYPVQIEAYKQLLLALNKHYGIELECPLDDDGKLLTTVHSPSRRGKFKGIVNHYNLTKGKWDTSGLQLDEILEEIRGN